MLCHNLHIWSLHNALSYTNWCVQLQAWKSLQLGVLTMWNACARNANMERHVVERGVLTKLLSIINTPAWPNSLREIAGGCMEFFMERYTNLSYLPPTPLPEPAASSWPKQTPPTQGLVPIIAAFITLINTRTPLLEYRGCHGLTRICYSAPYGTPDTKAYLKVSCAHGSGMLTIHCQEGSISVHQADRHNPIYIHIALWQGMLSFN